MSYLKIIVVFLAGSLCMTGCTLIPIRNEINDLEFIEAMGVDKCFLHADSYPVITATSVKQATSDGGGASTHSENESHIFTTEAPTMMEALKKLQTHNDKTIFIGHTDFFIFGEGAIAEDFYKYFDFLERYYEVRLTAMVFSTKGCNATDVITKASNGHLFIADRLSSFSRDGYAGNNIIKPIRVIELEGQLDKRYAAVAIPAIELVDTELDFVEGEKKLEKDIELCGYAIIKDFKLAGYIELEASRGYNIIKNQSDYTVISVTDPKGMYVSLDMTRAKTKIDAKFRGDNLEGLTITTRATSTINEQQSRLDLTKKEILLEMEKQQSEIIKRQISIAIDEAQGLGADFLGIADAIRKKHPLKWDKIEEQWNEIFPQLQYEVIVEAKITGTHDIRVPSGI